MRIASLGMYDHPAQADANDRLWDAMARDLIDRGIADVPARLDRTRPLAEIWRDPGLLFAQTCGYPLTQARGLPLRVLALPVYDLPGEAPGRHHSVFVARTHDATSLADYRARRAAINADDSNTGMNLFRAAVAPIAGGAPFFAGVIVTGSHRESARALVRGAADIAAIDAVTWRALERHEPELAGGLQVVGRSASSPTLPFVTAAATDTATVAALRGALARALADPALAAVRAALFLTGIVPAAADTFAELGHLREQAVRSGYPALA